MTRTHENLVTAHVETSAEAYVASKDLALTVDTPMIEATR
jgi:hypothetical protein